MDFNKAMIERYKQSQAASKKRQKPNGKRPKVDNESGLKSSRGQRDADQLEDSSSMAFYLPNTSLDDLYGCDAAKEKILLVMDNFVHKGLKLNWPILVCGSRGIGKTSIIEAAANHAKLKLIPISLKKLVVQSKSQFDVTLRQIEAHIRQNHPAVVLVDDLHKINEKEELMEMVGILVELLLDDESLQVLVFCTSLHANTTSEMEFFSTIQLKRPDLEARKRILDLYRKQNQRLRNLSDDSINALAIATPSFTPRDLKRMLQLSETKTLDEVITLQHCHLGIEEVKQSFKKGTHLIGEKPSITWNDIGGLSEVRNELVDIIEQVIRGDINSGGVVLHGPPGCGKTMVAQAMANEAGLNFIAIKPAELLDKFLGETEKNIQRVFSEAREFEPCMIYFDEFDGLCGTRGNKDNITSAIQTLLSEMDGFIGRGKSIVLVSTNRPEDIDPAMKRPGRLSELIYVGPPNEAGRKDILQKITRKSSLVLAANVDIDEWVKRTKNFTGAELSFLVSKAERKASAQMRSAGIHSIKSQSVVVNREHFEDSFVKIQSNKELSKGLQVKPVL